MKNIITVDVEKLKSLSNQTPAHRSVFNYLLRRQRGRQDTNIKRVQRILAETGHSVTAKDVSEVFNSLQDLGVGKVTFGRRGTPNRFTWVANLMSIKDILEGKTSQLYKQNPTVKKLSLPKLAPANASAPVTVERRSAPPSDATHVLIVRKGSIEIQVPANLTPEEAQGVAALLSLAS